MIVTIEGKDLRTRNGVKGWAGWRSEVEKSKFQELVLCPSGDRTEILEDEPDGLVALQARLEEAAAAVKATTTAVQEQVHRAGRDQGDGGRGGKMQGPSETEVVAEKSP